MVFLDPKYLFFDGFFGGFCPPKGYPPPCYATLLLPKTIVGPRRGKSGVFALSKVKKGPNRASNGPKMTKNRLKRAKNSVFGPKISVL